MKIYHKKYFRLGLLFLAAAALFPLLHLHRSGSVNSGVWANSVLFLLFGSASLHTAFDPKKAKGAMIHDHDEREQLLALQHYRTAFWTGIVLLLLISSLLHSVGSETINALAAGLQLSAVLMLAAYRVILLLNL